LLDLNPKSISKADIESYLNDDSVEGLKRNLKSANMMIHAIMDTLDLTEIKLNRQTLISVDGWLETYYDFDTDSYVLRRIK